MMTDNDLENLYKSNVVVSHYAALRAVWADGYNYGLGIVPTAQGVDPSQTASAVTATADLPTTTTDPSLQQP
jgi:hypothetical protein